MLSEDEKGFFKGKEVTYMDYKAKIIYLLDQIKDDNALRILYKIVRAMAKN